MRTVGKLGPYLDASAAVTAELRDAYVDFVNRNHIGLVVCGLRSLGKNLKIREKNTAFYTNTC